MESSVLQIEVIEKQFNDLYSSKYSLLMQKE